MLDRVPGLLRQMPLAGTAILMAGVALAGMPPFGLFASEVLITVSAYTARAELAYAFLALLTIAFATLLYQILRMSLGEPVEAGSAMGRQCRVFTSAALWINLAILGIIGLQIPTEIGEILSSTVRIFETTAGGR
jgi:hydrogenase-4 component F